MTEDDDSGLTPRQHEFLDWLLTPELERSGSQNAWANERQMAPSTLHRWKNDPRFIKAWEQRYVEAQTQPDRIAKVLDALWAAATGDKPDTVAAKEWLRWMERMSPQKPVDRELAGDVSKMSEDDLAAELRAMADVLDAEPAK